MESNWVQVHEASKVDLDMKKLLFLFCEYITYIHCIKFDLLIFLWKNFFSDFLKFNWWLSSNFRWLWWSCYQCGYQLWFYFITNFNCLVIRKQALNLLVCTFSNKIKCNFYFSIFSSNLLHLLCIRIINYFTKYQCYDSIDLINVLVSSPLDTLINSQCKNFRYQKCLNEPIISQSINLLTNITSNHNININNNKISSYQNSSVQNPFNQYYVHKWFKLRNFQLI